MGEKYYVPLNELSNGIYLLSISKGDKYIVYQSKIVKQN